MFGLLTKLRNKGKLAFVKGFESRICLRWPIYLYLSTLLINQTFFYIRICFGVIPPFGSFFGATFIPHTVF